MRRGRQGSAISSRRAERLLESAAPVGAREERLAAVLTALAVHDGAAQAPADVLAAFAQQAARDGHSRGGARARRAGTRSAGTRRAAACPERRPGSWAWRAARAAAVKAVVVVLAVSSGTVAAAAADMLPAPAQRAAHSLFGSWGVPAPGTQGGHGSPSPSAPSSASASTTATATRPSSSNPASSHPVPSNPVTPAGPGGGPAATPTGAATPSDAARTPTPDPSATNNGRRPTGKPTKTPAPARSASPGRERTPSAANDNAS